VTEALVRLGHDRPEGWINNAIAGTVRSSNRIWPPFGDHA